MSSTSSFIRRSIERTKAINHRRKNIMSAQTKTKSKGGKAAKPPASIVWFEIPADNVERAKKFYGALFGWKIEKFPGMTDYWHIDTGGGDDTPDGGLMARKHPQQP